jgi:hypothetical protein
MIRKKRPLENDEGERIAPTEEGIAAFYQWFNRSKVVDAQGRPRVVYHGTPNGGFTVFGEEGYGKAQSESGFWFSDAYRASSYSGDDALVAFTPSFSSWDDVRQYAESQGIAFSPAPEEEYEDGYYYVGKAFVDTLEEAHTAIQKEWQESPQEGLYAVYLSLQNPKIMNAKGKRGIDVDVNVPALKAQGFDGVILRNVDDPGPYGKYGYTTENFVAFYPEQVKLCHGNTGAFSLDTPDIRFSRGAPCGHSTLLVDGVVRPTTNSNGQPLHFSIPPTPAPTNARENKTRSVFEETRQALQATFGAPLITALETQGALVLANTAHEALSHATMDVAARTGQVPEGLLQALMSQAAPTPQGPTPGVEARYSQEGALQGFYVPALARAYIITENTPPWKAPSVVLHELGIHAAQDRASPSEKDRWKRLFERAVVLVEEGVRQNDPFLCRVRQRLDAQALSDPEEVAATLVEEAAASKVGVPYGVRDWVRDWVATFTAWLYEKNIVSAHAMNTTALVSVAHRAVLSGA